MSNGASRPQKQQQKHDNSLSRNRGKEREIMRIRAITKIGIVFAAVGIWAGTSTSALADFSWDMGYVFNGATPPGQRWLNISATQSGSDTTLTFKADGLSSGVYISEIYLNYSGILPAATSFSYAPSSGVGGPVVSVGPDSFQADGDGIYDIWFNFGNAAHNRFDGSDTVTFKVAGTTADLFNALSAHGPGGNSGPFTAVGHIAGYGDGAGAWVAPVPEPTTVIAGAGALGLLLLGLGAKFKRTGVIRIGKAA